MCSILMDKTLMKEDGPLLVIKCDNKKELEAMVVFVALKR